VVERLREILEKLGEFGRERERLDGAGRCGDEAEVGRQRRDRGGRVSATAAAELEFEAVMSLQGDDGWPRKEEG